MLDNLMQIIGGVFYLLNKVFLAISERSETTKTKERFVIFAWISYLIGLPAWIVIFYLNRNWIAGCLEAAGGPAMILGLIIALKGADRTPKWLDSLAFILIPIGIGYSIYDFGGITTLNQVFELGIASGFLIGTYLLAKQIPSGYLWFIVMHVFAGLLMFRQNYIFLMVMQIVSLGFIIYAYWQRRKTEKLLGEKR